MRLKERQVAGNPNNTELILLLWWAETWMTVVSCTAAYCTPVTEEISLLVVFLQVFERYEQMLKPFQEILCLHRCIYTYVHVNTYL